LLEWSQETTKLLLWLLPENATLLPARQELIMIVLWKVLNSTREWEVYGVNVANKTVHVIVIPKK
jgi:hypothetical protein